ncbi:MAG TPA: hypothetical protein VGV35_01660 [Bryobacteraceae bacterium]|nr:hypothetical protein [Bryobacteraceae bacterium]
MTMTETSKSADQVERYLLRFRLALTDVQDSDKQDVVSEIRSHIVERLEDTSRPVDEIVEQTLAGLGSPEALAARYQSEGLLRRASTSMSPLLLLRATLRWAMTGIGGFMVFFVLLIGYTMAAAFYVCAFLKPIFPDNMGLWLSSQGLNFSYHSAGEPGQELLGIWFAPVCLFLGCLCIIGTTKLARWLIRKYGTMRKSLAANA